MLQDFSIIHRRKPSVFPEAANGLGPHAVWATCLRSLAFISGPERIESLPGDEAYSHHSAYQFLLEIICGLHSPIIGETEVFGQFKAFAQAWVGREPKRLPLVQRLLNDAKSIRAQHLSHLGSQSYGGWLRKNLPAGAKRIHVLGGGHLVQEILPYLQKISETVVHVRTPAKVAFHPLVADLKDRSFDRGVLVVAAPMTGESIRAWLDGKIPERIVDLRDNSSLDPVRPEAVPLADVFSQIQKTKTRLMPLVETVKNEILLRSELLAVQEKVRPQGWDDLCA